MMDIERFGWKLEHIRLEPRLLKAAPRLRATAIWQTIHAVADRMTSRLRRAFLDAVAAAAKQVGTLAEVEAAVRTGATDQVLRALRLTDVRDELTNRLAGGEFTSALVETYSTAGVAVMPAIMQRLRRQRTAPFNLRFDMQHPRAVEFLQSYGGHLIREVSIEMSRSMMGVVQSAFEQGGHPYAQARKIRALENFGLTTRQNSAVDKFRLAQEEAGTIGERLDKIVDRYRKKLLRYRSENIARTETIRASEAGHLEAWKQAGDAGLFELATARRRWLVTPDDRLCDFCRAIPGLNPDGAGMDQEFRVPDGVRMRPPAHPQCRCSQIIEFPEEG